MDPASQPQQPQRGSEFYSTLEVDTRPFDQAPEVVAIDRENLPEVDHYRENLPEVNHNAYPPPPSSSGYETYSSGTHAGSYAPYGAAAVLPAKLDAPYAGDQAIPPPSSHSGTGAAAAAAAGGAGASKRICGVRRKPFIIMATLAAIVVIAVVVGVAVGVTVSNNNRLAALEAANDDSDAPGKTPASTDGPPNEMRLDTKIASSNFTDEVGNNNYLLVYQLNSGALWYVNRQNASHYGLPDARELLTNFDLYMSPPIFEYDMSTYNTSSAESKWRVSPIIDGKTGSLPLEDVQNGTSIAIDTYVGNSDRLLHLYWLAPDNSIRSARFDKFTTDSSHNAQDWYEAPASDLYVATAGTALISYGRECLDDPCPQWSYLFWQRDDALRGAGLIPGGQWEQLGPSLGASAGGFDSNGASPVGANSSLAIAMARATPADDGFRSISMFYRSEAGALGQIIFERNSEKGPYQGYDLPREDLGAATGLAAFTTGTNETASDTDAEPLGFQVLTADPDANNGVQLTYYRDDRWTVGPEVPELADCASQAIMTATRAQRVYCVVNTDDKAEIIEFAWNGDALGDVSTYTDYRRVGTVNTTVE